MRGRWFTGGVGEEFAAREFQVLHRLAQEPGRTRRLQPGLGQGVAEFLHGLFLEPMPVKAES